MNARKREVKEREIVGAPDAPQQSSSPEFPTRIQLLEKAWLNFPEGSNRPVLTYVYQVGEIIRDPELIKLIKERDILYHEV